MSGFLDRQLVRRAEVLAVLRRRLDRLESRAPEHPLAARIANLRQRAQKCERLAKVLNGEAGV